MAQVPVQRTVTLPTVRGIVLALLGTGGVVLGVQTSLPTLLALGLVGVGCVLAAGLAGIWVHRAVAQAGLVVQRSTSPATVVRGSIAHAQLRVTGRLLPRSLVARTDAVLRDRIDDHLAERGGTVHLELAPFGWYGSYQISPWARGRWPLGPVTMRLIGPAALVCTRVRGLGTTTLSVRPRTVDPAPHLTEDQHGGEVVGEAFTVGARVPSPDDALLRAYVPGDDVRRVHWRSSARREELMVRTDEHTPAPPVHLVLDRRLVSAVPPHPAAAAAADWPIDAAASIGTATILARRDVRLRSTAPGSALRTDPLDVDSLLEVLTDLEPASTAPSGALVLDDLLAPGAGTTVLITAPLDDVVISGVAGDAQNLPPGRRRAVVVGRGTAVSHTADELSRGGWVVVTASRTADIAHVVAQVAP